MAGKTLNVNSTLQCPHGGSVQIVSSNTRVKIDGALAALATDTFTVSGCSFQIPATPPIPSPCVLVQWLVTDMRVTAGSMATLSTSSSGLCLAATQAPQGPVSIVNAQVHASSE